MKNTPCILIIQSHNNLILTILKVTLTKSLESLLRFKNVKYGCLGEFPSMYD